MLRLRPLTGLAHALKAKRSQVPGYVYPGWTFPFCLEVGA